MPITRRALFEWLGTGAAVAAFADVPGAEARLVRSIRLNRNESAYGPPPGVVAAASRAARSAARYPDVESAALRSKIAKLHRVDAASVVLGCGAREILRMAVDAFAGPSRTVIVALPTLDLIGDYARRRGRGVLAVPLRRDYAHDLDAMLARSDAATGLVYLCNPNNPTGTLTPRREIEAFLRRLPKTAHVLVDEAYHHYAGESSDYESFIDRPIDDPRLVVVRTFSKINALAGLRIGYAVAAARTAGMLASCQLPDGVGMPAAAAAAAALDAGEHVRAIVDRTTDDRQEFFNQANARMLRAIDSQTNFVMLNGGRPAPEIIAHFRKDGILIGPPVPGFGTHVRVTLGTASEMREFWRVWDLMPAHKMSM